MGKVFKKILSVSLLVLFTGYLGCISLYIHSHWIDGELITHSHPYSGSAENPGHTHSSSQIITIAQLTSLLMLAAVISILAGICSTGVMSGSSKGDSTILTFDRLVRALRGPPVQMAL